MPIWRYEKIMLYFVEAVVWFETGTTENTHSFLIIVNTKTQKIGYPSGY